ncbi:non-hydrolyzing UDP-N-acetylglucosamine 2-epimerase [Marinitoga litoralis]|uniref:non-hydrolyzing UDP-N-acetylglucosamine 2-epimerase n=1 Tax=Marinitoga litoralis TaxID=570855 RepID=UPI0019621FF2|nr:UDP-N-acetylglucosamine 2-epimerase (non-hydrolyzing) [Marinitoga litoralis]MBM7560305.1 UDP-N-acetylglucosamine 2-epimerase (non-hydrolyzing) [Marinitoga litoralis]
MKVLSLIGARPQFIKEAVLHKEFLRTGIAEILVHSGQHYDFNMSDVFFQVLDIRKPNYFLNVGSGNHGEMTARIMFEFEKLVMTERPDIIIVYGDTNTTLAGAIVGAKLKIPVAHVEAGIRQEPKDMPEEINRVLTDHVSRLLFCPSQLAVDNLKREGITQGVYFSGDVMYDLFLKMRKLFRYNMNLELKENEYVVCTIHRDFNTDMHEKLKVILEQLGKLPYKVVFPMHPRTVKRVKKFGLEKLLEGIKVLEPVDYLNMMGLVERSKFVITDSGGLQKEAYWCGKRAVVVMPDTGWRELVEIGWNLLSKPEDIVEKVTIIENFSRFPENIYGDGNTGESIVKLLKKF